MIKKTIFINGMFYRENMTGIERFSYEMMKQLDVLAKTGDFSIVIPADFKNEIYNYKNVKILYSPKTPGRKQFNNIKLHARLFMRNRICLDFGNSCPKFCRPVVFLHDIYCRTNPEDFSTQADKRMMRHTCNMYERIAKKAEIICTVSEFSKSQIVQYYGVPPEKIHVIYDSADHMKEIVPDYTIFQQFNISESEPFYFTLGSLSKRKNLGWIAAHAKLFPDENFVIAGGGLSNVVSPELEKLRTLPNVILTGRLSDGAVKALMQKCRAFIFPSYFEGFGLPPLEALMCGTQIIVSCVTSLPEIYEDCAHYIEPDKPNVNLDELLSQSVSSPEKLFKKYSLDKQAKKLYDILGKMHI